MKDINLLGMVSQDTIRFAQKPSTGTLRPDKESNQNWDTMKIFILKGITLKFLNYFKRPITTN